MSNPLAHPGHVWTARKWLKHNAGRIAAAVEPPGQVDKEFTGEDFVRWIEKLLESHHQVCEQEFARRPPFTRYTGD
jgi:hypothetical protein